MNQIANESRNSGSRRLLMETLAGHMALLQETHPRKAASPVTQRARQCVRLVLRQSTRRKAA